jgi:glutamate N-acetyltransferase/amino-acid N-acetyltransferase
LASTGVIGRQLDVRPFVKAVPELAKNLSPDGFDDVAKAMMTTDTVPKTSHASVMIGKKEVSILGIAKGSGMIMPDMATMLCFIMTDAQIVFQELKAMLKKGVDRSFNRITVDGDTSTNDMVLALANGAAGNAWVDDDNPKGREIFSAALDHVLRDLALQIVADGEGASKLVTIRVEGVREAEDAVDAAQTIANSALVKTAFFGEDANWGRIIAALGRSGCPFEEKRVDIYFDTVQIVKNGVGLGEAAEKNAQEVLCKKEFTVTVDLHDGLETAEVYTCDFSYDYIKINADYRT